MSRGRPPLTDWHGTYSGYRNHGCRCDACDLNYRRSQKRYRIVAGRDSRGNVLRAISVDADRVRDHIDALRDSGYPSLAAVAREAGVSRFAVERIAAGARRSVQRRVALAILALEPLQPVDLDPVVVDRLVAGADWRTIGATRAERIAAAERLDRTGAASRVAIERRLGLRWGRDVREDVAS